MLKGSVLKSESDQKDIISLFKGKNVVDVRFVYDRVSNTKRDFAFVEFIS